MSFGLPGSMATQITIRRQLAGSYVKGRWQDGGEADPVTAWASVQPAGPRQKENLPEGVRDRAAVRVITDAPLAAVDESAGIPGDLVDHDGETWEVQQAKPYRMGLADHVEAVATKVSE